MNAKPLHDGIGQYFRKGAAIDDSFASRDFRMCSRLRCLNDPDLNPRGLHGRRLTILTKVHISEGSAPQ